MQSFYKHLRNGETKDDALRHAKQDYLNNVTEPEQKSPYYWAGFVLMGDTSPVYYRGISARIIILLAGVVILGGFLLWRLRAKRQLKGRIEGHDFS